MIIGLTGRNGSGKGTVAEVLKKRGFAYYSLSDVIREDIRNSGQNITREHMIEAGRRLRKQGGPGVLAEMILQKCPPGRDVIVDSIRNPAEVHALKRRPDFYLVFVDADRKIRFERCVARAREGDPVRIEDFIRLENAELESVDESGQQLIATEKLSDLVVENNGAVTELELRVDEVLARLRNAG